MRSVRPIVTAFAVLALLLGILAIGFGVGNSSDDFLPIVLGIVLIFLSGLAFFILTKDPAKNTKLPTKAIDAEGKAHILTFSVGDQEKHMVVFTFDQKWGWLTISVDDVLIVKKLVTFTFRLVTAFDFSVGHAEVHNVRIEKHRALVGSFARPQPIKGFVDGVLVAENDGNTTA